MILTGFATLGSIDFGKSFAALLWMSTILCAVIGTIRRETPCHAMLNHWDEMAAFGALSALAAAINHHL